MEKKGKLKSKEKRAVHKENQKRFVLLQELVIKAKKLENPLEKFVSFQKFNRNGVNVDLYIQPVTKLDDGTKSWIFELTKNNMEALYQQCSWKWNDREKREELMDDDAMYLLAKDSNTQILVGFAHFRFDIDEDLPVLYCYEVQLEAHCRRKGLGKFMVQVLELIGFSNGMHKVVLTVLKHNPDSIFFKTMNYQLDETSPSEEDELPYEILSKPNRKLQN